MSICQLDAVFLRFPDKCFAVFGFLECTMKDRTGKEQPCDTVGTPFFQNEIMISIRNVMKNCDLCQVFNGEIHHSHLAFG